jgi:hypothetical protein
MPEPEGPSPISAFRPLSGILRVERTASPPFARADQYRWMIGDRVTFTQSLEVSVEMSYGRIGSRWKSVAFWYQLPDVVSGSRAGPGPTDEARLLGAIPNPVRGSSTVRFRVPSRGPVHLSLLDVAGRRVRTLEEGVRGEGWHEIPWSREGLVAGVYFLRLRAGGRQETSRVVLVH